ncbi:MAG: HopJ type III effector protein [Leptospirales bacterium]
MDLQTFLHQINNSSETVTFDETMEVIDTMYDFVPVAFSNGTLNNDAGQNNGSCKLFSFSALQGFSSAQTLACFGDYYRKDVLGNPEGTDHQNIRNFMKTGWDGIKFTADALAAKSTP